MMKRSTSVETSLVRHPQFYSGTTAVMVRTNGSQNSERRFRPEGRVFPRCFALMVQLVLGMEVPLES